MNVVGVLPFAIAAELSKKIVPRWSLAKKREPVWPGVSGEASTQYIAMLAPMLLQVAAWAST